MNITLAKGGTEERVVPINKIVIPDLWHAAQYLKSLDRKASGEDVLKCWHLCHDLKRTLEEIDHEPKNRKINPKARRHAA